MKLRFANLSLSLVTPLVTGVITTFAVNITASSSLAVTLASSEATAESYNFSYSLQDVRILTDTNVNLSTVASDGVVVAQANANAVAHVNPNNPPQGFSNFSFSLANGEGNNYSGLAQSQAEIIAYDFSVGNSKPFSFDFDTALNLSTSIDNPQTESANVDGQVSFNLYDSTDSNNLKLLDSLTISGNLVTPGNGDYLNSQLSNSFTLTSSSKDTSFGGTQKAAFSSIQGNFSRSFTNPTLLTLVEVKTNDASVLAVPEPSNTLGLVFYGLLCVGVGAGSKLAKIRS